MSRTDVVLIAMLPVSALMAVGAHGLVHDRESHRVEPVQQTDPVVEERRPPAFDACDESTYTYIWNETQGDMFLLCPSYGYGIPAPGGAWVRCWGPNEELAKTAFVSVPLIVLPYELPK